MVKITQELKRIASFEVDHLTLEPGLYLSRRDEFGQTVLCSYDVRITAPNREPYVNPGALHTLEHLFYTFYFIPLFLVLIVIYLIFFNIFIYNSMKMTYSSKDSNDIWILRIWR